MPDLTTLLDRPLYSAGQAASLLQVRNAGTVVRWLEGYTRAGVEYPPVIRAEKTGSDVLTWGEFVEARYVAALRADGASLQRLRLVIATLRERFGTRYPLAHAKPFMDGRDVVLAAQKENDLPHGLSLVVLIEGQVRLSARASDHYDRFDWVDDLAMVMHPAGRDSPVIIDPTRAYGMPSLTGRNLKTELIAELFLAGDSHEDIAAAYDLQVSQVDAAVRWEMQTQTAYALAV